MMVDIIDHKEFWIAPTRDGKHYFNLQLFGGDDIEARLMNRLWGLNVLLSPGELVWFNLVRDKNPNKEYQETNLHISKIVTAFLRRYLNPLKHILVAYMDDSDGRQRQRNLEFEYWTREFNRRNPESPWVSAVIQREIFTKKHFQKTETVYLRYFYAKNGLPADAVERFFSLADYSF